MTKRLKFSKSSESLQKSSKISKFQFLLTNDKNSRKHLSKLLKFHKSCKYSIVLQIVGKRCKSKILRKSPKNLIILKI